MNSVGKAVKLAVICAVLTATTLSLSLGATKLRDGWTDLRGDGTVQLVSVYSSVTKELVDSNWVYTYSYSLDYKQGSSAIHVVGIDNPNNVRFFEAANDVSFSNPVYNPLSTWPRAEWKGVGGVSLGVGLTGNFSYKSTYGPQDIPVYAYVIDGGAGAEGIVIGMGDAVPEPAGLLALACGMLGIAPKLIRRRK